MMSERKKAIWVGKSVEGAKGSEELWKETKTTLGWNKQDSIRLMKKGDEIVEKKDQIASNLNDYFLEKIDKINEKIPETNKDPLSYTKRIVEQFPRIPEMRLRRVPIRVVKKTIRGLRNSKSTSHDDISTYAIKQLCNEIAPWMKRLIILSFEENKFPDPQDPNLLSWKCTRIVPIYKGKGDKTEMSSYRPSMSSRPPPRVVQGPGGCHVSADV